MQKLSIIVPAFNEARHIGNTLTSLNQAKLLLKPFQNISTEIIVVDNGSNDSTSEVARSLHAAVVTEAQHNIARVRNAGARNSQGNILIFVDADTIVPDVMLAKIVESMADQSCFGGVVDTEYQPKRLILRPYLQFWRLIGKLFGMAQGATQFYRKDMFLTLNGYDETLFMGEDVDLFWRLRKLAKQQRGRVARIDDIKVTPSARRFDQWPLWRTLVWTNPVVILFFRRRKAFWSSWYDEPLR